MDKLNERKRLLTEALKGVDEEIENLKVRNIIIALLLEFSYNRTNPKHGLAMEMIKTGCQDIDTLVNQYEIDFIDQEMPYKELILSYYRTNNKEILNSLFEELIPELSKLIGVDEHYVKYTMLSGFFNVSNVVSD